MSADDQARETHRMTTERLRVQREAAEAQAAADRAQLAAHYAAERTNQVAQQ